MSNFRRKLLEIKTFDNDFNNKKTRLYTVNPYDVSVTRLYFLLKPKNYNSWSINLCVKQDSVIKFGIQFRSKSPEYIINRYNNYGGSQSNPIYSSGSNFGDTLRDDGWIMNGVQKEFNNTNYNLTEGQSIIIASTYISSNTGFPENIEIVRDSILKINNLEFY